MDEIVITCPQCGHQFPLNDALAAQLKARLDAEHRERLEAAVRKAEGRARKAAALEKQQLEAHLAEQREKLEQAQKAELELRQKAEALEARAREIELEIARRLDARKAGWEAALRQTLTAEQNLKLKEKEKQIEDMKRVIEELKRKSEQGSQALQGGVLELDIQAQLERQFPHDEIQPVPKGLSGADLIQTVIDSAGRACGKIIWETKNTKHFSHQWLTKLKDATRAVGGSIAVLVSSVLPEGLHEFGLMEGVWVASWRAWPALAVALREQLVQVAFAHAASEGRQEKMEVLYRYLSGDAFRHRVTAIVEAFTAMQDQLARERRALERLWKEREKQIERVMINTVGMYGELRGCSAQACRKSRRLPWKGRWSCLLPTKQGRSEMLGAIPPAHSPRRASGSLRASPQRGAAPPARGHAGRGQRVLRPYPAPAAHVAGALQACGARSARQESP